MSACQKKKSEQNDQRKQHNEGYVNDMNNSITDNQYIQQHGGRVNNVKRNEVTSPRRDGENRIRWYFTGLPLLLCVRGAVGPLPDVVPLVHLPGRVPAEGSRFSGAAAARPVRRLRPGVLLRLQGRLAPRAGVSGEQPAHHLLPAGREQVPLRLITTQCHMEGFPWRRGHGDLLRSGRCLDSLGGFSS